MPLVEPLVVSHRLAVVTVVVFHRCVQTERGWTPSEQHGVNHHYRNPQPLRLDFKQTRKSRFIVVISVCVAALTGKGRFGRTPGFRRPCIQDLGHRDDSTAEMK